MIEVRSEYTSGKLLFKWDEQNGVVNLVVKDTVYSVQLNAPTEKHYEILKREPKPKKQ